MVGHAEQQCPESRVVGRAKPADKRHDRNPPGRRFRHITAGGGGYGQPLQRESARVLDDVLDGKISTEYAERVYGVVMVESGDRVDDAATRSLRDRLTAPR